MLVHMCMDSQSICLLTRNTPLILILPIIKVNYLPSSYVNTILKNGNIVLSSKKTKRDFLYIADFVDLLESILYQFPSGYNVYNVGYGSSHTLKEATEIIVRLLKKEKQIAIK